MSLEDELSGGGFGGVPAQRTEPLLADQGQVPLTLSPDEMSDYGHHVMDLVVQHLTDLPDLKAAVDCPAQQRRPALAGQIPWKPTPFDAVLDRMLDILAQNCLPAHPRYFAFVPNPSNAVSIFADLLATAYNLWPATWLTAPGATAVELEVIDWIRELCGLPQAAGGLCVSGGSEANLTALRVARYAQLEDRPHRTAVAYCSDQTHSSVARALGILGFAEDQLRLVPTDAALRMDIDRLRAAVRHDREAGLRPFCVIGTAGTTNTGAFDPLEDIADLCQIERLWFHVDGAIGAAAKIGTEVLERSLAQGLERADSLVFDPHKGLAQPYELGCVLVRDRRLMQAAFTVRPEYLQDADAEVNLSDLGIQLARRSRALKMWASMITFGVDDFAAAIDHGIQMAQAAEQYLRSSSCWRVTSPAQMGILTFRYELGPGPRLDELQREIVALMMRDGFAMVASTRVHGQTVLRLAMNNPRTTVGDVHGTIDHLEHLGGLALQRLEFR